MARMVGLCRLDGGVMSGWGGMVLGSVVDRSRYNTALQMVDACYFWQSRRECCWRDSF
jgi:hypothetical protein